LGICTGSAASASWSRNCGCIWRGAGTGLGFDQEIPHHSLFEQLFEEIVAHCLEAGLVGGDNLSVDGSFVEANASKESRMPREQSAEAVQVNQTVRQYLVELERQNPTEVPVHEQKLVSTTDPDATYATKGGTTARMGYDRNHLVDNHSCVIGRLAPLFVEGRTFKGAWPLGWCAQGCAFEQSNARPGNGAPADPVKLVEPFSPHWGWARRSWYRQGDHGLGYCI
jgi:hypothetical protein